MFAINHISDGVTGSGGRLLDANYILKSTAAFSFLNTYMHGKTLQFYHNQKNLFSIKLHHPWHNETPPFHGNDPPPVSFIILTTRNLFVHLHSRSLAVAHRII